MNITNLKDIIKDNVVNFHFLRANVAYYKINYQNILYMFPVTLEELGDGTLLSEDKAIYFMRYIRKAIENDEFVLST